MGLRRGLREEGRGRRRSSFAKRIEREGERERGGFFFPLCRREMLEISERPRAICCFSPHSISAGARMRTT